MLHGRKPRWKYLLTSGSKFTTHYHSYRVFTLSTCRRFISPDFYAFLCQGKLTLEKIFCPHPHNLIAFPYDFLLFHRNIRIPRLLFCPYKLTGVGTWTVKLGKGQNNNNKHHKPYTFAIFQFSWNHTIALCAQKTKITLIEDLHNNVPPKLLNHLISQKEGGITNISKRQKD